jgi:flavin-dependent dehydrogenase
VTSERIYDVAVVGAGPAGAVVAIVLSRLVRSVVLIEAAAFPRSHIGISVGPGVRRQLYHLGLGSVFETANVLSGIAIDRRWASKSFARSPEKNSMIVDRALLDGGLVAAAKAHGVTVLQPARVRHRNRCNGQWRLEIENRRERVVSRFLIDASGRGSRYRRKRLGASTLAVYGNWGECLGETMLVATGRDAWAWASPIGRSRAVVICFVDPRRLRTLPGSIRDRYLQSIADIGLPPTIGTRLETAPIVCDATSYAASEEIEGLLRIGDADIALDPLSSSGVQAAIQSAMAAGPIVNTMLQPEGDFEAATAFWRRSRTARLRAHTRWALQLYTDAWQWHRSDFWLGRSASFDIEPVTDPPRVVPSREPSFPLRHDDLAVTLSPAVRFVDTPCLVGPIVAMREGVQHSSLSEPTVFLAGAEIARPLKMIAGRYRTIQSLQADWTEAGGRHFAELLLEWAWSRAVIVPRGDAGPASSHAPDG